MLMRIPRASGPDTGPQLEAAGAHGPGLQGFFQRGSDKEGTFKSISSFCTKTSSVFGLLVFIRFAYHNTESNLILLRTVCVCVCVLVYVYVCVCARACDMFI